MNVPSTFNDSQKNNVVTVIFPSSQFGGPDCVRVCLDLSKILNSEAANVGGGGVSAERLVYSSRDAASGQRDIHNLFNFADMQLGI